MTMHQLKGREYDSVLLAMPKDGKLGAAVSAAMEAVEDHFPPLAGQLPKDYERFEDDVLEEMMRTFDSQALRTASGDVFGRIYEYFLAEFSKQGAHDNGEFFAPPSIVQTIVNVIEPDHGVVLDPACGSGGMFVQSSHFIEDAGDEASHVLRPREERDHREARPDQPRRARIGGQDPRRQRGHHLLQGPARAGRKVRLRDGQSALGTRTAAPASSCPRRRRAPVATRPGCGASWSRAALWT